MADALGLTKYGFKLQFLANGETSSKTYNNVNFTEDNAQRKLDTLKLFLKGGDYRGGLYAIMGAMSSPYSIVGQSITQENTATFT